MSDNTQEIPSVSPHPWIRHCFPQQKLFYTIQFAHRTSGVLCPLEMHTGLFRRRGPGLAEWWPAWTWDRALRSSICRHRRSWRCPTQAQQVETVPTPATTCLQTNRNNCQIHSSGWPDLINKCFFTNLLIYKMDWISQSTLAYSTLTAWSSETARTTVHIPLSTSTHYSLTAHKDLLWMTKR